MVDVAGVFADSVSYNTQGIKPVSDYLPIPRSSTYGAAPFTNFQNSQYNFNYLSFPGDLANGYHGHYMVININVRTGLTSPNTPRGAYAGWSPLSLANGQAELSTIDRARASSIAGAPNARSEAAFTLGQRTRRITDSIALYMPAGLVFDQHNRFEEISMTSLAAKPIALAAGAVGAAALSAATGGTGIAALGAAAAVAKITAGALSGSVGSVTSLAGYPINPRVEVLWSHTDLRTFRFEVLMAPRNEEESFSIKKIIETLRFHASPELDPQTAGFTFIPPAEFDISFYNKGEENTNIPRINTCVLNLVQVDYAPANGIYSTFRNGYPVAVRLSLAFTEIEPLHKARIAQGF